MRKDIIAIPVDNKRMLELEEERKMAIRRGDYLHLKGLNTFEWLPFNLASLVHKEYPRCHCGKKYIPRLGCLYHKNENLQIRI